MIFAQQIAIVYRMTSLSSQKLLVVFVLIGFSWSSTTDEDKNARKYSTIMQRGIIENSCLLETGKQRVLISSWGGEFTSTEWGMFTQIGDLLERANWEVTFLISPRKSQVLNVRALKNTTKRLIIMEPRTPIETFPEDPRSGYVQSLFDTTSKTALKIKHSHFSLAVVEPAKNEHLVIYLHSIGVPTILLPLFFGEEFSSNLVDPWVFPTLLSTVGDPRRSVTDLLSNLLRHFLLRIGYRIRSTLVDSMHRKYQHTSLRSQIEYEHRSTVMLTWSQSFYRTYGRELPVWASPIGCFRCTDPSILSAQEQQAKKLFKGVNTTGPMIVLSLGNKMAFFPLRF